MLKKILLFFIPLLISTFSFAQKTGTIKGLVTDSSGTALEFISVVVEEGQKYNTITDKNGAFELNVPADKKITLVLSSLNTIPFKGRITVGANEVMSITQVVQVKQNVKPDVNVIGERKDNTVSTVEIKNQTFIASVNESFESNLQFQGLGVSKTNELSSSYSVRGGNFDENLVYVND